VGLALCGTVFPVSGGGGGCDGGGVPLGAVPTLSMCGGVSLVGIHIIINSAFMCASFSVCTFATQAGTESEVDALGVITISRGYFERCCRNKKKFPYHSNLSFVTLRNRRPTQLRAPAYCTPFEASPRRRCGHASQFLLLLFASPSLSVPY